MSYANANTLPIINTVNTIHSAATVPFVFAGEGEGKGNIEFPCRYPYCLGDVDAGLSGLVYVWCKWCSGSHLIDNDDGDVSASVLSGWCVMSRLDAATSISANAAGLSELSKCEHKSVLYGHWDSDNLYMSGLESSR